jgi:FkbM family methyltransferase
VEWKRVLKNAAARCLHISIARTGFEYLLVERCQLKRFIDELQVDCVFDVGANTGQYANLLREIGFKGPIVSFEPTPSLACELRQRARGDPRWIIEEVALDDKVRRASFNIMTYSVFSSLKAPDEGTTASASFADANAVRQSIELTTGVLADYFDQYESRLHFCRPFLKLDTQGNDVAVARGARDRLVRFIGLQSELAVKALYRDQPDYHEAIQFYRSSGFEINSVLPTHPHFPELIEFDCIMYNRQFLKSGPLAELGTKSQLP